MVGFKELLRRLQIQEQMTKQHQTRVDVSTVPARLHSLNVKKRLAGTVPRRCQGQCTQMSSSCLCQEGFSGEITIPNITARGCSLSVFYLCIREKDF